MNDLLDQADALIVADAEDLLANLDLTEGFFDAR